MDRNAIGRESKAALNEVEKGAIRRFAEALGETNPIYFEEAAARAAGYRSIVAPPTFPTSLRAGSDLREGLLLSPGKHLLQAEQSFEYARPIVAGHRGKADQLGGHRREARVGGFRGASRRRGAAQGRCQDQCPHRRARKDRDSGSRRQMAGGA